MARVLMVAYSCEPGASSEGAVGWELASRIARRHHVTLLTRPKARADIDRAVVSDPGLDLVVEYHEMHFLRRLKYLGLPVSNLRNLAWNHRMAHRVAELEDDFDVVHQTTWVRHWVAPAGAGATSIPFVWGPVGAAESPPWLLSATLDWRGVLGEVAREVGPRLFGVDPLLRKARRNVAMTVASSRDTHEWLRTRGIPATLAPSVGYDPTVLSSGAGDPDGHFVSVGRLLGWKGFHLGLEAFARLGDPGARYVIVGEGPQGDALRRRARELGVGDRVDFKGRVSASEAARLIGRARMLVHPSLHDSGGFVVVEAMAQGVPVVCLDIGGPAYLSGDGGVAVSASPTASLVERLTGAMREVNETWSTYSERSRQRARELLDWERIVDRYDEIYDGVMGV